MILFGTAGWSYRDWDGTVYPESVAAGFDHLAFLVRYLDCIEINSTFYFPPPPEQAAKWAKTARSKKGFLFTAKLWQRFTHTYEPWDQTHLNVFKRSIAPLLSEGVLGALLIQYPWFFEFSEERLESVLALAAEFKDFNPCVEFRHTSWMIENVLRLFEDTGISFANIDQPYSKTSLTGTAAVTSETGYLRLHGRNSRTWFKKNAERDERYDYVYSMEELSGIARIVSGIRDKAKRSFIITNNHFRGSAFKNALELKHIITGEGVTVPASCLKSFKDLKNIASHIDRTYSPRQADLFLD